MKQTTLIIGTCLAVASASGQDTHTINFDRDPVVGQVVAVQDAIIQNQKQTVAQDGNVVQETSVTHNVQLTYQMEVLGVSDDGNMTAVRVTVTDGSYAIDNNDAQPLGALVITSQWQDGAATFDVSEGDLPADPAVVALIQEMIDVSDPDQPDAEAAFDPGRTVAVGDTWPVDKALMLAGLGDALPMTAESITTADATLASVEDGMQTVGIQINADLTAPPGDPAGMPPLSDFNGTLSLSGTFSLEADTDHPPATEAMQMAMNVHMAIEGQSVTIDVEFNRQGQKTMTLIGAPMTELVPAGTP